MQTTIATANHDANETDTVLSRGTLYSALAIGFQPPDQEAVNRLLPQASVGLLALAAGLLDDSTALAAKVSQLRGMQGTSLSSLISSYQRIFGHTARGAVPPYETEYGDDGLFQQPQQLGDLAGFYKAFGLKLNTARHERLDHVSCEFEFMAFLALKEAYAIAHDDTEMLQETQKAGRLFLRDHLGRFGPTFARKLTREDRDGFYGALGDLCFAFLNLECKRIGVEAGPLDLSLRPATDDQVPMACGSGAECTAMPGATGLGED